MTTARKPQLSGLALASLLLACVPAAGCAAIVLSFVLPWVAPLPLIDPLWPVANVLYFYGTIVAATAFLVTPLVIILASVAMARIRASIGFHRGTRHAVCAIILSFVSLAIVMYTLS